MPNPWVADRENPVTGRIIVKIGKEPEKVHEIPATATSFALEADGVARAIVEGRCEPDAPAMTWADSLGAREILERLKPFEALGKRFEPTPVRPQLLSSPVIL